MVNADGWQWLRMGGGVRGWAVVVADGADACKEKTKQNKKIKRRKNLLVDLECRWMWTRTDVDTDGCRHGWMWSEHGGTVDDSARLQVCLDLEIFEIGRAHV